MVIVRKEDPPRSSTGSSSAKSSCPIPQAPEHQSQLGDMKLVCPCQKPYKLNLKQNLVEKILPNENAREFAIQNIGNNGHQNTCGTSLTE